MRNKHLNRRMYTTSDQGVVNYGLYHEHGLTVTTRRSVLVVMNWSFDFFSETEVSLTMRFHNMPDVPWSFYAT